MVKQLTPEQVRRLRLRAQRLDRESARADVAQVVRDVCGLQAQELPAANLAVRARTAGLTVNNVIHAREVERSLVLTWTMRGTMHLVAAEDLRWMLALFGADFIRQGERRFKQLKLDETTRRKAAGLIQETLGERGPLTRAEIAQALAPHGIPVEGQAIHHLVRYAALEGIICFGPERGGELTYVVLDDWLPAEPQPQISSEHLLAELARRYLQAYAPAALHDMISWSGLSTGQVRAAFSAIAANLLEVETPSGPAWMLKQQRDQIEALAGMHAVRLLPRYDTYLLGYQSRAFMVDDTFAAHVHPGGGLIRSSAIVDGQARGVWRMEPKRHMTTIVVQPFETFSAEIVTDLEAEAQDIGRFLNQNAQLRIEV